MKAFKTWVLLHLLVAAIGCTAAASQAATPGATANVAIDSASMATALQLRVIAEGPSANFLPAGMPLRTSPTAPAIDDTSTTVATVG